MENIKPPLAAMIGGGALLLISTFLAWQKFGGGGFSISSNAWDRSFLTGLFLFAIAVIAMAVPLITNFAPQIALPHDILGFSPTKLVTALGSSAFVISFGLLFQIKGFQIGSILAVVASAAIVAGGLMDDDMADESKPTRSI